MDAAFKKNDDVLRIMDAIMVAIDGEPMGQAANALQYVLNLLHAQACEVSVQHVPPSARLPGA